MLKHSEVNPLNVHGLRQLKHCPPHFTEVVFDLNTNEKAISDWIFENLTGRFYVGYTDKIHDEKYSRFYCAAFEEPGEASFFSMFLSQINPQPNFLF